MALIALLIEKGQSVSQTQGLSFWSKFYGMVDAEETSLKDRYTK